MIHPLPVFPKRKSPLLLFSEGKVRLFHQQNELNETLALNFQSFNPEHPDSDKFLKIHCTYHL